jgi:anhydro-N-acetylmuramic acid kinase
MTGTSLDGIDAVCVCFDDDQITTAWSDSLPYDPELKERVFAFQAMPEEKKTVSLFLKLDQDLAVWYAKSLSQMMQKKTIQPSVIANHGQTVFHQPPLGERGLSVQMGNPFILAYELKMTAISGFRQADLAAFGQGAPLAPRFHEKMAHDLYLSYPEWREGLIIHNLGGFSNLTYIKEGVIQMSFDTGPANSWIDEACLLSTQGKISFDNQGQIAQKGQIRSDWLALLLEHPFFQKKPPKSTGRDDFRLQDLLPASAFDHAEDLVATTTEATAISIAKAYADWVGPLVKQVLICGGGAFNSFLIERIQHHCGFSVASIADKSSAFVPQMIEAQAFAWLGFCALHGVSLGGSWTGARSGAPSAGIIPGENYAFVQSCLRL